ncbi:unnamed protein product [Lampetra planeri]
MVQANNGVTRLGTVGLGLSASSEVSTSTDAARGGGQPMAGILQLSEPEKHTHPSLVGNWMLDRCSLLHRWLFAVELSDPALKFREVSVERVALFP